MVHTSTNFGVLYSDAFFGDGHGWCCGTKQTERGGYRDCG